MKSKTFKHVKTGLVVSIDPNEIFPPQSYWYSDKRGQTYSRAMIENSNDWLEIQKQEYTQEDLINFANYCVPLYPEYSPKDLMSIFNDLQRPKAASKEPLKKYFCWTDELVNKFVKWLIPAYTTNFDFQINTFKKVEIDRKRTNEKA